jgi:leucyl-tRNA synthetase
VRFAFPYKLDGRDEKLWVFTTRADTIMGVTFCAVAAEHPLATHAARGNPQLAAFIEECKLGSVMEADIATMEKKGMPTGISVTHPLTGEAVPVWVGNYVLMGYGEGAVMAVPAHDERDFHFAKQYGLPIKQVIAVGEEKFSTAAWVEWYEDKEHGRCVNSGKYDGLGYSAAVDAIAADLKAKDLGDKQVMWRLRDWGVSRQRYWGCPIPIIYCDACGDVPVPDRDLPVVLPEDCVPDGSGNPLNKRADFVNCKCPKCGAAARRETDTMDTFVDSSWYYARFASGGGADAMVDAEARYWMPVDQYIGGIEHAILHLLYSRFWWKVMRDAGLVRGDEPFRRLLTQGMVLAETFYRVHDNGRKDYYFPTEVSIERDAKGRTVTATLLADGAPVTVGGIETMSKSKNNGVDPQDLINRYGADTARLFMMFAAPPEQTLEWSDAGVEGAFRFLKRLWDLGNRPEYGLPAFADAAARGRFVAATDWAALGSGPRSLRGDIHALLEQANRDFDKHQFNTVVAACMKMVNTLAQIPALAEGDAERSGYQAVFLEAMDILVRLLSPVVPHITHAMWQKVRLHDSELVIDAPWPRPDALALVRDSIEMGVQVNGKLRGRVTVPASADQEAVQQIALTDENVVRHIDGKAIRKVIVVPGKLVNIVV